MQSSLEEVCTAGSPEAETITCENKGSFADVLNFSRIPMKNTLRPEEYYRWFVKPLFQTSNSPNYCHLEETAAHSVQERKKKWPAKNSASPSLEKLPEPKTEVPYQVAGSVGKALPPVMEKINDQELSVLGRRNLISTTTFYRAVLQCHVLEAQECEGWWIPLQAPIARPFLYSRGMKLCRHKCCNAAELVFKFCFWAPIAVAHQKGPEFLLCLKARFFFSFFLFLK